MTRVLIAFLLTSSFISQHPLTARAAERDVPTELGDYVARPDSTFEWKLREVRTLDEGKVYDLDLTSQTWQGIVWRHSLAVYEPAEMKHPEHVLLYVTGGSQGDRARKQDVALGTALARYAGARVAVLNQVPNQPLLDGRKEDDLITETWLRYLRDGDPRWPLLFPMVKSAVRAMDAVQALAATEWQGNVRGFVISGGSKRGWTSWLTAAVDPRLVGTAPMVIDVLNFRPQMDHQLATWGVYSEQIADYSSKGLIKHADETERERRLREMMDPYSYIGLIRIPKLLIHGTNDRYWSIDATKFYWNDLVGPKFLLKLPNDGHGLENNRDLGLRTLGVFFRKVARQELPPTLEWSQSAVETGHRLEVEGSEPPRSIRLWRTTSPTKDFREATWTATDIPVDGKKANLSVSPPASGHFAYFCEFQYEFEGIPYSLTTMVYWQ